MVDGWMDGSATQAESGAYLAVLSLNVLYSAVRDYVIVDYMDDIGRAVLQRVGYVRDGMMLERVRGKSRWGREASREGSLAAGSEVPVRSVCFGLVSWVIGLWEVDIKGGETTYSSVSFDTFRWVGRGRE